VRLSPALVALAVVPLTACGSGGTVVKQDDPQLPSAVVRAWSAQVNDGDDEGAAALFARGARIIQGERELQLVTNDQAVAWNRGLPCSGRILAIRTRGELVNATFELGERPGHRCDAPGAVVKALFRVHAKKIVLWHQLATERVNPIA
jgi:hypothetical protein